MGEVPSRSVSRSSSGPLSGRSWERVRKAEAEVETLRWLCEGVHEYLSEIAPVNLPALRLNSKDWLADGARQVVEALCKERDRLREDCAVIAEAAELAPDTHTGTRQRVLRARIAAAIRGQEPPPWLAAPEPEGESAPAEPAEEKP